MKGIQEKWKFFMTFAFPNKMLLEPNNPNQQHSESNFIKSHTEFIHNIYM